MTKRTIMLLAALLAAAAQTAVAQEGRAQADKLMAAAQHRATVVGDLHAAIAQYRTIAETFKHDRAVAASALLRIAEAHEKLGDGQARRVYEQILRDYADQPATATARAALLPPQTSRRTPAGTAASIRRQGRMAPRCA